MKLSRLEIFGFKSFAKKLDLRLAGGITAVVGPNGCGKTNIVDAIRWVLGEQRPTQIRLERMEDILFKGSVNRHQLGMSEVSLTIENDSGTLALDMPEITITRRLFRSGESDYMINRKSCRLADINDLLMDTGMGTDSYSVFELAMINAILSDKTDDRRHIFEEAAGVTKYKARRRSALNKLLSIENDLERVGDIIIELKRRVDSLKRQASKAKRYRTLKSAIKSKTITLASFELEKHKGKISEVNRELDKVQSSLESIRVKISGNTAETERLSAEIVTVEKELEKTAGQFNVSMEAITGKEKELARLDSRLESLDEIVERARETAKRNTASLEKLAGSHGECGGNLAEVTERLEGIEVSYDEISNNFRNLNKEVAEKTGLYSDIEREYRLVEQEIATQKAALANVNVKREGNDRRLSEISARIDELGVSLITINEDLTRFSEQKLRCIQEERGVSQKIHDLKKSLDECIEDLEALDRRRRDKLEKQAGLKAERDFLAEVIRSYEGYSEGVKNAVRAEHLKGRVLGVLADLISTDERYVPAVEAALRDSLQTILVESTGDAVAGAKYLSEERRGRAAFLPLDGTGSAPLPDSLPGAPGVIGLAHEFVRTDERFVPVVRRLFSGVVIVDTLETAISFHEQNSGTRYVTLTGEMVGPLGDIHGGSIQDTEGKTIGRAEKLKTLEAALEKADSEVHSLQIKRSELSERYSLLRGLIDELENTLEKVRKKHSDLSSSEAHTSARKDAVIEMLENLNTEAAAIKKSFTDFDSESEKITEIFDTKEDIFHKLGEKLAKTGSALNDLKTELETRRSAVNSCEVERAAMKEKKASLSRELGAIGERREALAQASGRTLLEIDNAEREILEAGETKKKVIRELELMEQKHESFKNKKDEIEKRYSDMRAERSEKESNLQLLRREIDEISRKESSLILTRDETVMVMNNIRERLSEEYFIDPEVIACAPENKEFNPENERLLLDDLRRKLHLLGDVNLAAETDYDEEKKRLDFLEKERNDLIDAGNTLKDTITKINKIARVRFTETFEKIQENFRNMFQEFFNGGVCELTLEEGEDPLESGILISARPPGKNVCSINLLSSGERALTAISLLFAIYLVKPSPFCILDEVDAPLDDANIDRFLKVIREFSHRTQFIMVTHNKKTMAAADNLYGITMAEPGLSTLVSVRLSETESDDNAPVDRAEKEEAVTA